MDNHDEDIEVPQYFVCPISLQIMKDPVTAATGITYDRSSIEQWLKRSTTTTTTEPPVCPVTKQPLSNHHLTPNHTLYRLIQAWSIANASRGVERIPTPKAALSRAHIMKILRGLSVPTVQSTSLDQLLSITSTDLKDEDRKLMVECGVFKATVSLIIRCYKENRIMFLSQSLKILTAIWVPTDASFGAMTIVADNNNDFLDALTWVLLDKNVERRTLAINLVKAFVKVSGSSLIERLRPEFFKGVVGLVQDHYLVNNDGDVNTNNKSIDIATTKAALRVLLELCKHGRNRIRIIEFNTIFHLIELAFELCQVKPGKYMKLSELVFCLLAQLCSCADGRAKFLAHCGGIAVVSKRILRVSSVVDDRAVHIFGLISKFSATNEVLHEMLKVGAVSKLCMVLQADCAKYLKDKVREMLRMHSCVWNNSPCIQVYLLTR